MNFICRTCQSVLDVHINVDGSTYQHPPSVPDDHEVVAVPMPDDFDGGKCDFCSQEKPRFLLPADDFRIPHAPMRMSHGAWAACEVCAGLIKEAAWARLARRAADHAARRMGRERAEIDDLVVTHGLFTALRANITGPVRPIVPETE